MQTSENIVYKKIHTIKYRKELPKNKLNVLTILALFFKIIFTSNV